LRPRRIRTRQPGPFGASWPLSEGAGESRAISSNARPRPGSWDPGGGDHRCTARISAPGLVGAAIEAASKGGAPWSYSDSHESCCADSDTDRPVESSAVGVGLCRPRSSVAVRAVRVVPHRRRLETPDGVAVGLLHDRGASASMPRFSSTSRSNEKRWAVSTGAAAGTARPAGPGRTLRNLASRRRHDPKRVGVLGISSAPSEEAVIWDRACTQMQEGSGTGSRRDVCGGTLVSAVNARCALRAARPPGSVTAARGRTSPGRGWTITRRYRASRGARDRVTAIIRASCRCLIWCQRIRVATTSVQPPTRCRWRSSTLSFDGRMPTPGVVEWGGIVYPLDRPAIGGECPTGGNDAPKRRSGDPRVVGTVAWLLLRTSRHVRTTGGKGTTGALERLFVSDRFVRVSRPPSDVIVEAPRPDDVIDSRSRRTTRRVPRDRSLRRVPSPRTASFGLR